MKSILISIFLLLFTLPVVAQRPQIQVDLQIGQHRRYERHRRYEPYRYRHGAYTTYETRYVRIYGELYRETYRVRHLPSGRRIYTIVERRRIFR